MKPTARRRLLLEGGWVAIGQIASALGTLVGVRLLTEILPPFVFGEVVLLTGIGTLALGLSAGPLMQGVLRYYSATAATNSVRMLRTVATRWVRRFAVLTGTIFLTIYLIFSEIAAISFWPGVLLIALLGLDVVRQLEIVLFNASRRQRPTAIWLAAEAWIRPALAWVAIVLSGATAEATLSGFVTASFLIFVAFAFSTEREGIQKAQNDHGNDPIHSVKDTRPLNHIKGFEQKEIQLSDQLIQYALPLIPLGLIGWISGQADRYMIGGMIGVEQAGLYAALYGVVSRPFLMAGTTLEMWIRPIYYEAVSSHDSILERKIFKTWMVAGICTGLGGFALFFLWNSEIASALLALPYRAHAALMPWIAAGYALLLIAQVYVRVCYAHKNTKAVLAAETIGAVSALMVTIPSLKHFGMAGAAYAVPVYFFVQMAIAMMLARRTDKRSRPVRVLVQQGSIS